MEKYQIIPRRFRPKKFSEVAGHEAIVTTLKNALKHKRVAQAYLFCGARGCGKTTLARLFAKSLNCSNLGEDLEPCTSCSSCTEISEGRNLDIIEIDGASNRGIDDIRQINETVGYAPNKGHYKIYIIDEVHMLTKEAFNALLKTLEEPPENVKFFFATTEPHKIPQTIISRCQRFNLSRIPQTALVEKLSRIANELQVEIEKEALIQIGHLSEGSLRDAESLLDQLICYGKTPITLDLTREVFGLISNHHLFELDEAIQSNHVDQGALIAKTLYESGKDMGAVVDGLLEHYRTYLQIKLGEVAAPSYQKYGEKYTKQQLLTLLDTLIVWQQQMVKIPFKAVHLEMLLLNLVRSCHKVSLDGLIERLIDLESRLGQGETPQKEIAPALPKKEAVAPPKEIAPEPPKVVVTEPIKEIAPEPPKVVVTEPIKEIAPEPPKEVAVEPIKTPPPSKKSSAHPSKYETLVRFAAVELEGSYERS